MVRDDVGGQLERLVDIMARLRAEGGCPWDREQDLRSLRPYLVEETYEVLDEMDRVGYGGPWAPLCEELGDLLFQIVFHAQLARELGEFGMADVAKAIANKIERRHPHVFGEAKVTGAEQVLQNWAVLKAAERKAKHGKEGSVLDGVPTAAPSLQRAERLTEKASRIGFDWPDLPSVRAKLGEELAELDEAIRGGDRDALEHELGDVLLTLANLSRFIKTAPEDALRMANRRFTERFQYIEQQLQAAGVPFGQASLEQMEAHWQRAKKELGPSPLPAPLSAPAAHVVALSVPVADLAAEKAFTAKLAALAGWALTPGFTVEAGGWAVSFHAQAGAAPSGLRLDVVAGRKEVLPRLLEAWPGAEQAGDAVRLRSPGGVCWNVSFLTPGRGAL
ncbi:MAG: nucleoside triphosphate pyrophosphohydrolase [Deltaproteobacteria bacterium]|nr:nucleoside triphosphate pyrophosphohydrolase [Deltaproteobacteria bacterium]